MHFPLENVWKFSGFESNFMHFFCMQSSVVLVGKVKKVLA